MPTQNGTGTGTGVVTVPVNAQTVPEVDDSNPHHHLNPKMTEDLVKGSKISPQDLAQNAVKGLPTKILPCLPQQCLHPPSQS